VFRLLAPGQTAKGKNVYSYKYILDCINQNRLLDLALYRLVHCDDGKLWIFCEVFALCYCLVLVACVDAEQTDRGADRLTEPLYLLR